MQEHIICQPPFNNHKEQLIINIITFYINIRLYHEGRELDKESRIRNKLTKLILFNNE